MPGRACRRLQRTIAHPALASGVAGILATRRSAPFGSNLHRIHSAPRRAGCPIQGGHLTMRPDVLLPARWVHWSWLSPPQPARHERALREASVQLIRAYPGLATPHIRSLAIPTGRPAFARLCRLVAATAAGTQVRRLVSPLERRQLAAHIGGSQLDQLQRRLPLAFDAGAEIDLSDRFALTVHGLALIRRAQQRRGLDAWWSMRLPRALSEPSLPFLALDGLHSASAWQAPCACGGSDADLQDGRCRAAR